MTRYRWGMIALCFIATAINYIDRANLGVAAVAIQTELKIDPAIMGIILGGFFWTYALMQMPSGYLIDRFGPRPMYALAVGWWSVFTAATALTTGAISMLVCRLLLGAGEAGAYPSNAKVTALWFPRRERGIASSIFDSGSRVGSALSLPVVVLLIAALGWRGSFLVTGLLGFIWIAVWLWLYRDPERHPRVSREELNYIRSDIAPVITPKESVRWVDLFRYRTIWGMMIGFFCLNFVIYFFITWFPTYLIEVRGFSLKELGTLGSLPALAAIPSGWLGGFASDWLYRRGWSLTAARKTCLVGGMLTSSVIALSPFVQSIGVTLALLALSYGSLAFAAASIWSLPADVAPTPDHVGSIAGIQNFASNLAGIITSTFTGVMVSITQGSFVIPLVVAGAFSLLGAFSYLFIVGRIEPLPPLETMKSPLSTAHS